MKNEQGKPVVRCLIKGAPDVPIARSSSHWLPGNQIVGIVDPPRAEAKEAIAKCHSAGIPVRMITGDYVVTGASCSFMGWRCY
jgi:hypothetical protein